MVRRAFTLLEVLMVIVILGLIATVVVTQIGRTEERAKQDLAKQQTQVLAQKIEIFRLHCGRFPEEDEGLEVLLEQPDDDELEDKWAGPYVKPEQLQDPWGNDFVYQYPGEYNENSFDVSSPGPDGQEGNDDDIGNWQKTD
jgi:general secretion pathway protein G